MPNSPTPARPPKTPRTRQPRAVRLTLGLCVLGLLLLQAWRPLYFLTDDNLCGWMPVVADAGRSLARGESPFVNPHLYGGGYELLHDPANLCLWHPLVLALALASQLPFGAPYLVLTDVFVSLNWLLCAFAMAHLLCRVRDLQVLEGLSDRRIALLSLSFTFSSYALIMDASWATFAANQAALPVVALGLLHPRRREGVLLVGAGFLHALLSGHLSPLIFSLLFVSVFVGVYAALTRSGEVAVRWALGLAWATLVVSPLLVPALRGFLGSARSGTQNAAFTEMLLVPLPQLVASFFVGKLSVLFESDHPSAIPGVLAHVACCVGATAAFHSWGAKKKQGALEWAALAAVAAAVLFVVRPAWLTEVLSRLPVLRSLRIPVREVLAVLFFAHLWIALRPVAVATKLRRAGLALGATLFVTSFASAGPPSFSDMELDRSLLFSGAAQQYWDERRASLRGKKYVCAIEDSVHMLNANLGRVPWTLLGAYNYAALFELPARGGYFIPGLSLYEPGSEPLNAVMGIYALPQATRLQEAHPEVVIFSLVSLDPPRIDRIERGVRRPETLPPLPNLPALQPALRESGQP